MDSAFTKRQVQSSGENKKGKKVHYDLMSWASSFKSMMFHVSCKNKSETKVILNARNSLMCWSLNMTKEFKPIPWLKRLQVEKHLLCSQVKQLNVVSLLCRSWEQILWHVATRVRAAWSRYEGVQAIRLDPVSAPSVHLRVAQSHAPPPLNHPTAC